MYTFTYTHIQKKDEIYIPGPDKVEITIPDHASLDEILDGVRTFLIASGYYVGPNESVIIDKELDD